MLPNSPQFLIAEMAAWKAGAAVLPLNPLYTADELAVPLAASRASVAVVLTPFYRRVKSIQPRTALRTIVATSIKEYLSAPLRLLFTLFKEKKDGHRVELEHGDLWLHDCLHAAPDRGAPPLRDPLPDDDAVLLLSGGTTGAPNIVVGRHAHLVAAGTQLRAWLDPQGRYAGSDVALVPLPLFHVYACVGAQAHALVAGRRSRWCPTRVTSTTC